MEPVSPAPCLFSLRSGQDGRPRSAWGEAVEVRRRCSSDRVSSVVIERLARIAVSEISRFVSNPGKPHLEAVERVFRYIHETKVMASHTILI